MSHWIGWAVAAGVLAVGELLTLAFVLAPLAVAAAVTAGAAALGLPFGGQLLLFAGCSLAALVAVRPIARRHQQTPPRIRTGVAALTGQRATVVESIEADHGRVKIAGEIWSARALDPDARFAAGTSVTVVQIDGATAIVIE